MFLMNSSISSEKSKIEDTKNGMNKLIKKPKNMGNKIRSIEMNN